MVRNTNGTCYCPSPFVVLNGTACECPTGQEVLNGVCVNICPPNTVRQPGGSCICLVPFVSDLGNCVTACGGGREALNGECVTPCPANSVRNSTGGCGCLTGFVDDGSGGCIQSTTSTEPKSTFTSSTASPNSTTSSNSTCSVSLSSVSSTSVSSTALSSSVPMTSTLPTVVMSSSTTVITSPSSISTSAVTSPSSTSTSASMPSQVGNFSVVGRTGSDQSYPSFRLQITRTNMTLEMCTAACSDFLYAGVHSDIPCPGNLDESCGGFRQSSRLARRQTSLVPSDALLVIYINDPIAATATLQPVVSVPSTSSSSPSTPLPPTATTATAIAVSTATATAVVTATSTVYPCVNGYCNQAGWFFELCQGAPNPGEVVFVMEACSCAGGWQFVVAGCDGTSCGSLAVYRAMPCAIGVTYTNVTVYQPQACGTCAGGVTFVQGSGSSSSSSASGSVSSTTPVVVAAGANKIATFVSSLVVAAGAFVLLI